MAIINKYTVSWNTCEIRCYIKLVIFLMCIICRHPTRIVIYRGRDYNSMKNSVNYLVRNDGYEDRLFYPITSARKKIKEFLFSKLTPRRHLEHGTGPGTHLKQHTVGGQTSQTKQNAVIHTTYQRPMVSKRDRLYATDNYTSQHAQRRYTSWPYFIYTIRATRTPTITNRNNLVSIKKKGGKQF